METSPVTGRMEEEEEPGERGNVKVGRGHPGKEARGAHERARKCTKMLALGRTLRGKGVPGGKPKLNGPNDAHRRSRSNPILRGEKEKMPVC